MQAKLSALFQATFGREAEVITRAPGRIEFIGNHTDYNGGTVLGAAIDRNVWVAVAKNTGQTRRFYSEFNGRITALSSSSLPKQSDREQWVNYPLGVLAAMPVFGLRVPDGFDLAVVSDLPAGAGLSSSAALEIASTLAFLAITDQTAPRETIVTLGRHAENHFVGVPCGILDQGVSGFGRKDALVFIDCRGPRFDTVPLPPSANFWVFNTHAKHALVDGLYAERHRECMEAARVLGVKQLVDISARELALREAELNPVVFRRARHVVEEIGRVGQAVEALGRGDLAAVGRLLTASHASSKTLFENSTPELDFLVEELSKQRSVHGARLTGGGFGGAVMALASPAFDATQAEQVLDSYDRRFQARPDCLHLRTGEGAAVELGR
ncbi:MAG: galactokinase [Opitutaceae bacterium]|nr:galactokinase [Opitutaceae bacterium]